MAKEADIKKIELRVSVNCCDGCKRKVKKALQGVEGVLKTEIDPSQPKVTAVGNVDPKVLIKRLLKVGKQAELLNNGNQNTGKGDKEVEILVTKEKEKEKEKPKPKCEKAKPSDSSSKTSDKGDKDKESKKGGEDGTRDKTTEKAKDEKAKESAAANSSIPAEVIKNDYALPPQPELNYNMYPKTMPETGNFRTQTQYCYMIEPYPITVPYYAIPSYPTYPLPPACYGQPYYSQERPVFHPQFQAPLTRVGDYFSDENTVGCSVM